MNPNRESKLIFSVLFYAALLACFMWGWEIRNSYHLQQTLKEACQIALDNATTARDSAQTGRVCP